MAERVRIKSGSVMAEIAVMGAELRSLQRDGAEVLWQADPAFWDQTSPLLFPICGRAIDNRVTVGGRDYKMAIHGFAMLSAFRVAETRPDFCAFELVANDETCAVYPFDFRLSQSYRLEGASLTCMTEVMNTGTQAMPFSFGYHPGFALPLPGLEGQKHEVRLGNGASPAPSEQQENFLTGGHLETPFQDGRLAVTDASFSPSSSIILATGAGDSLFYGTGGRGLEIRWRGLENLVLWRPQRAGFLCVEPWQGLPTLIGAGPELAARPCSMTLAPGEAREFGLSVDMAAL